MPDFRFPYETVLEQRRRTERQRQRELAELQQQQQAMKQQLREMQQTVDASRRQLGQGLVGRVDLSEIGSVARYSAQVTFRGQQLVQQIAAEQTRIEQAQKQLMEATRQRRILEQLKQRRYEQWLSQQRCAERRQQDELATQAYVRGDEHGADQP